MGLSLVLQLEFQIICSRQLLFAYLVWTLIFGGKILSMLPAAAPGCQRKAGMGLFSVHLGERRAVLGAQPELGWPW